MKTKHESSENTLQKRERYMARVQTVLDYIDKHLSEPLPLEKLADLAHFSRFHFHRQFSHSVGMPLNQYIRLLRFKKASFDLAYDKAKSLPEISAQCGFENSESFSRAFKHFSQQSPSDFRTNPKWETPAEKFRQHPQTKRNKPMDVSISLLDPIRVAVLEHHGSPNSLHNSVGQFIEWRKTSGQSPESSSMTIGVPWNDPNSVNPDEFSFDICGSLSETEQLAENDFNIIEKVIPGGRCAVVTHIGSTDAISKSCYFLYQNWLPDNDEELRDFPCFFHYKKRMPVVPEHEQITDIYLPLK